MKKLIFLLFAVSLGWFFPPNAKAFTLEYTLPSYNSLKVFDPELGDSVRTCQLNINFPLTDLKSTKIYWYPFSGGTWTLLREKLNISREGQVDTLIVPNNASYYITFIDFNNNESCASIVINAPMTTGVPVDQMYSTKVEIYTVHGRKIESLKGMPSGVYFRKYYWNDGTITKRKFVYLR
jgi:hypothetical protein